MARFDSAEVGDALREAGASYLRPECASYLRRRLAMGACSDLGRTRCNVGALRNLRFGFAERKSLSVGAAPLSGEMVAEHQKAYRRGTTSWLPYGAIPKDPAERMALFEERCAYLEKAVEVAADAPVAVVAGGPIGALPDASDDDLLGVGLASFPSLQIAAQELVRVAFRAGPRDWREVSDEELAALDRYPELQRVAIPGAPELSAPLGWVPGVGPSEAAEETYRKLCADWEAFENVAPGVDEQDLLAWHAMRDAWRDEKIRPTEVGGRLVAEVERARRIRAMLVGKAPGTSADGGQVGDAGGGGFFDKVGKKAIVAGGFAIALVTMLVAPSSSLKPVDEEKLPEGFRPRLPSRRLLDEPEHEADPGVAGREDAHASDERQADDEGGVGVDDPSGQEGLPES